MKIFILFILIISILFPSVVISQEVWTLQRCIEHAKEMNLDLKIMRNVEKKSTYDLYQSKWNLAPSINANANTYFNLKRAADADYNISSGTSYSLSYNLSSSLTLFEGFTKLNSIAAAKFYKLATSESSELHTIMLVQEVTELYFQVLYQRSLLEVAHKTLDISIFESERIAATIETGQLEAVAQNEINAVVSANKLEYNKAENMYKLLKLRLLQLIEIPIDNDFEISDTDLLYPTPIELLLNSDSLYIETCINYPAVLQKEYELEYYRKLLNISKGNHSPSIVAFGGINSGFYSTDTQPSGNITPIDTQFEKYLSPSLGASLNIPVFNGKYRTFNTKKSKIDLENAMYNLEIQKKQIRKEIEEAVLKLYSLWLEYQSASDNLEFTQKSFDTYREKFQLGMINTTDFLNIQNQLSLAVTNLLLAKYSWIVQKMTIDIFTSRY
ncbi:MAG: TolC family protein [Marinilabiliaceae bacterium]|nr:TolC family protein [Marinilabiliaceae bacterium]